MKKKPPLQLFIEAQTRAKKAKDHYAVFCESLRTMGPNWPDMIDREQELFDKAISTAEEMNFYWVQFVLSIEDKDFFVGV